MNSPASGSDRVSRIGTGVVLVGLAATGAVGAWGWIGVPLLTGAVGFCPAYPLLGRHTCPIQQG
jgi:hypothetical protein